jgi:hypothetical protein
MAKKPKAAAPKKGDSRWITVRQPFNYYWPSRAVTHWSERDLGEHRVKNEVADFAVEGGYAVEGKLEEQSTGASPDTGTVEAVDNAGAADADRAAGGQPLDPDAE